MGLPQMSMIALVNRVRIHPVFSNSSRAIVLPDTQEEPVTRPTVVETRARSNGHPPRDWRKQADYTDLAVLAEQFQTMANEVARVLKELNQSKAELADQKKKADRYDEMVVSLSRSETERDQAVKAAKDTGAVLGLVREALKDYLNDRTPGTATLNNLASAMGLLA